MVVITGDSNRVTATTAASDFPETHSQASPGAHPSRAGACFTCTSTVDSSPWCYSVKVEDVRDAHEKLSAFSGPDGGVQTHGRMTSATRDAIKKFQTQHNLKPTGRLDPKTRQLLQNTRP